MSQSMKLDIVSAETTLFSGEATRIFATSTEGEFEVCPGHAQLIALLKPGTLEAMLPDDQPKLSYYISGGVIEVQPDSVTVLADTAMRADDLDEATAQQAQQAAREKLASKADQLDHSAALAELAAAAAQLRLLKSRRPK